MNANPVLRLAAIVLTLVVLATLFNNAEQRPTPDTVPYSQFLTEVDAGKVERVSIEGSRLVGTRRSGEPFTTWVPDDSGLVGDLLEAGVAIEARPEARPGLLTRVLISLLPFLLLIAVFVFLARRQLGGGAGPGGILGFGRSTARRIEGTQVSVTLADVAGVDEAKEEVAEVVEFLRDPSRFQGLGGTVPRGILMAGAPGTGKTLLARAIAGEAGVPFFTVSGSDFVEMFAGVGASRVRDLFAQAKKSAPCIVFVDEIDAVGRRRGAGMGGGNDEREQTLNQMLVEMDGFEGNEGVIVIAATNRPDVLDPALLRPGRFDRQVTVPLPDMKGRAQVLRVHMRKVPLAPDVDAHVLARGTPGFSGADLANLVNEAALMAARSDLAVVDMSSLERAKDKVLMGAERRGMSMSEADLRLTAYHEAGHAIVGRLVPEHDPVHKVSIIPRGGALGVTLFLPDSDRYSASRRRLESEIATLLGGRAAEEIVFGGEAVTTGAANDIQRATRIALDMVASFGLSDTLGPVSYGEEESEMFLGRAVSQPRQVSEPTARRIDHEVRTIVVRNHARARALLEEHREILDRMALALLEHETLSSDDIDVLMAGGTIASTPSGDRGGNGRPGRGAGARGGDRGERGRFGRPVGQHRARGDAAGARPPSAFECDTSRRPS